MRARHYFCKSKVLIYHIKYECIVIYQLKSANFKYLRYHNLKPSFKISEVQSKRK